MKLIKGKEFLLNFVLIFFFKKKSEGKYIKSIVYGGLDGIITIFASVSSVAGASLSGAVVVIVGIANLFADALAMGFGDFLSSTAESEFELMEKKREEWYIKMQPFFFLIFFSIK